MFLVLFLHFHYLCVEDAADCDYGFRVDVAFFDGFFDDIASNEVDHCGFLNEVQSFIDACLDTLIKVFFNLKSHA